ncbi:hypothetical protein LZ32DRAFT_602029 [Colletotrichum eremochloae]|nr:hypothetical protein LZ32DRAFT_602029 [Colletotrichum eremochloae]
MDQRHRKGQSDRRLRDNHRPQRRLTVPPPTHQDPSPSFGSRHSYSPSVPFDPNLSSPYHTQEPSTQLQGTGYAPDAAGPAPQHGRYPQQRFDGFYSSSAPTHTNVFPRPYPPVQHYNDSARTVSSQGAQDSDQMSTSSLSYSMRQNNGRVVNGASPDPSTMSSSTSGRYYEPDSSTTTPRSSHTPNLSLSRSPVIAGVGSWANTTAHSIYPAPPEDHRGRQHFRLNISGLPGRSLRSESTEVHRHHSPSGEDNLE